MRKTILVTLLVALVAMPCLAHELETDGVFSIEGTAWIVASLSSQIGYCIPFCSLGFYGEEIYMENESEPYDIGVYFDLPLVSPFLGVYFLENLTIITLGVMQPAVGYGVDMTVMIGEGVIPIPFIRPWYKVSNTWKPE
jgi:hypothetical protein